MRAGEYARISEHDEKVAKVANQLIDTRKHAEARGYTVDAARVHSDELSATNGTHRPGWTAMLADIRGGKIDVLVAVDEDRLCRDLRDKLELHLACAETGVIWETVRGGVVDPSTADGEFLSVVKTAVSRMEIRKKVERQKTANHHLRMQGRPLTGTRPFGFEVNRITHREDEAKEIAWAYATVISTGKLYPVLKDWNARGVVTSRGNKWSYATLQQLLRRASNAGLMEHEGDVLEGVQAQWDGFVPREDWQTVVSILSNPQRQMTPSREPVHLLPGLVHCGTCGSVMRSSGSTNKPGEKIYRCATKISAQSDGRRHASIKITDLDPLVRSAVIEAYFTMSHRAMPSHDADVASLTTLHGRLPDVRRAIEELIDSIGQPGYTKARVDQAVAGLAAEETQIMQQIDAHARQSAHAAMLVDTWQLLIPKKSEANFEGVVTDQASAVSFEDAGKHKATLTKRFDSLTLEQRRTLVRSLVRVTVHGGRKLEDRVEIEHV